MSHSKRSSPTANSLPANLPTPLQGVLGAAVLAMPTGIVICDPNLPDCPIIYANPAFYRITGYSEEEVIGHNCRFLQGPGTNPRHIKAMREAIENGKAIDVEIVNHRKDGSRFVNELHLLLHLATLSLRATFSPTEEIPRTTYLASTPAH